MQLQLLLIMPLAFICELIDSSLGMGYGTILTPILLLLGYEPLQVVPTVLFSEFVSGILAAFFHNSVKNVNFRRTSRDTKVTAALSTFAIVGTILAVYSAVKLPPHIMKTWIGAIVLSMGLIILIFRHKTFKFSWWKISLLGGIASFNKGMSGGGYGPLVVGGQMLSGVGIKNAVGITSLSEGITCLVGIIFYYYMQPFIDWSLAPWLMAGAVLSVPVAAQTLKKIPEEKVKLIAATVIILLGCLTLVKVF